MTLDEQYNELTKDWETRCEFTDNINYDKADADTLIWYGVKRDQVLRKLSEKQSEENIKNIKSIIEDINAMCFFDAIAFGTTVEN